MVEWLKGLNEQNEVNYSLVQNNYYIVLKMKYRYILQITSGFILLTIH